MQIYAMEEQTQQLIAAWANAANTIGFNPASGLYAACHLAAGFINAMGGKNDALIDDLMEVAVKTICEAIDEPIFKASLEDVH